MKAPEIYDLVRSEKIIVIIRSVGADKIVDLANALYDGGIKLMEITCNTPGVCELIRKVSVEMAGRMVIGAGTVITKQLCQDVISAGAEYIIAPDTNCEVIDYCISKDIAVIPGAATATEILTAVRHGAKMIKIFPAACIGVDCIKMLKGPIDDVDFIAVGGVRLDTVRDFMKAGCIGIGIGGSIIRKDFLQNNDWQALRNSVKEYVDTLKEY